MTQVTKEIRELLFCKVVPSGLYKAIDRIDEVVAQEYIELPKDKNGKVYPLRGSFLFKDTDGTTCEGYVIYNTGWEIHCEGYALCNPELLELIEPDTHEKIAADAHLKPILYLRDVLFDARHETLTNNQARHIMNEDLIRRTREVCEREAR